MDETRKTVIIINVKSSLGLKEELLRVIEKHSKLESFTLQGWEDIVRVRDTITQARF